MTQHLTKPSLLITLLILAVTLMVSSNRLATAAPEATTAEWSNSDQLSTTPRGETPRLAQAPDGTLITVYVQEENNIEKPYYRTMASGSAAWSAPNPIWNTANMEDVDLPAVAFDSSSQGHAVWVGGDSGKVYYARQQDGWPTTTPQQLSGAAVTDASFPAIAIGPNDVIHAVWMQGTATFDLYYSSSSDGGASWSTPVELDTGDGDVEYPFLLVGEDNTLYTLWQNFSNSQFSVFSNNKPPGAAWTSDNTIVLSLGLNATFPTAVILGNDVLVNYVNRNVNVVEDVVEYTPYFVRLRNGTTPTPPKTFGKTVYINTNSPFYVSATSAACDDKVYYYYHGGLEAGLPEQIIGYTYENSSWMIGADQTTNTSGTNLNVYPSLVCRNTTLHMVYQAVVNGIPQANYLYREDNLNVYLPLLFRN